MKGWPFGVALRGETPNRHMLRWLKTVVVSDVEKASLEASGGDQEGERKRIADDVSTTNRRHRNWGRGYGLKTSLADTRLLASRCPAWRRREPDLLHSRGTWEGESR